jgi:glutathione-regulated potassium-efflux system ancillary protein KefC
MSSTAIVLQILSERGLSQSTVGQDSFSVLLFQDLAIIPILALIPLLGIQQPAVVDEAGHMSPLLRTGLALGIVAALVIGSRTIVKPLFRWIATTRQKEIFTAAALLIVVGVALLMDSVGLSMALGTFLAGVVLADCEYRHELESNIEPFKGLLLGIFFTAVGGSMDFSLLSQDPGQIVALVVLLLVSKILIMKACAKIFKHDSRNGWIFSVLLSQGGEFAFVLFTTAQGLGALTAKQSSVLTLVVALSMFTTPFLLKAAERFLHEESKPSKPTEEKIESDQNEVIIAGMGRFGQIVARLLHTNGMSATIIDYSPDILDRVRAFGFKVYYGDATELKLLESAGLEHAKVVVLAIDDREACLRAAEQIKKHYPKVRIMARAFDMMHAYELMDIGVEDFERETFDSALSLGERVLVELGWHPHAARRVAKVFHRYDKKVLLNLHSLHKQRNEFISGSKAAREELGRLFAVDEESRQQGVADAAWMRL